MFSIIVYSHDCGDAVWLKTPVKKPQYYQKEINVLLLLSNKTVNTCDLAHYVSSRFMLKLRNKQ